MGKFDEQEYWVPNYVREHLRGLGFHLPLEAMEGHIRAWHSWLGATGDFYEYRDRDGFGRVYEVHRRSIHPAMRVCNEWGSLLLNDKTQVVCDSQECTDWLSGFFKETGFMPQAQNTVVRAFGMGTGAWALWVDADAGKVRIRHYDARMVIPLTWDEEGVTECAFVTRVFYRGKAVDQLQMHLLGGLELDGDALADPSAPSPSHGNYGWSEPSQPSASNGASGWDGASPSQSSNGNAGSASPSALSPSRSEGAQTYHIVTACFDEAGELVDPVGVCADYDTGCPFATFSIVKPAVDNTRVDMSPYGQSVFADAIDAIQAVDLTFDAMVEEINAGKMRIFLSDVMFDREKDGAGKRVSIPFGKNDCTVFRKVMSTDDMVQEFAPALRTSQQAEAFRVALQLLGDLCGFGLGYFDFDESRGYVRTATEVASDNSALMRTIAKHEHALESSLAGICRALLHVARGLGHQLPAEGSIRCEFDDSIVTDTAAQKAQDMAEVGVTLAPWEYRVRWYGESEQQARERAAELGTAPRSGE